jgi:predicted RNase H-like nuclease
LIFTGFDSAWGHRSKRAVAHLQGEVEGGQLVLRLLHEASTVDWQGAAAEILNIPPDVGLHVVAIDQCLVVRNHRGMRNVERHLASALMRDFRCGAHASNTSNPVFGADAGIWDFLECLDKMGFRHHPSAVPGASSGRFYFECYPHPALIALFRLDRVLPYKVRKEQPRAWEEFLRHLSSLQEADPALMTQPDDNLPQAKTNEDKLDALICAYLAAFFWRHGLERNVVLGDLNEGYIVTPFDDRTLCHYRRVFDDLLNPDGPATWERPATQ